MLCWGEVGGWEGEGVEVGCLRLIYFFPLGWMLFDREMGKVDPVMLIFEGPDRE